MASTVSKKAYSGGVNFFRAQKRGGPVTQPQAKWVSMGLHQEGLYSAVAVSLIDKVLSSQKLPEEVLKRIYAAHVARFPTHQSRVGGLFTIQERFAAMAREVKPLELTKALADTIQALSQEAFEKHARDFAIAYANLSAPNSTTVFQYDIPMAAIAKALGIALTIQSTSEGSELVLRHTFQSNSKACITLRQTDHEFLAKVSNKVNLISAPSHLREVIPMGNQVPQTFEVDATLQQEMVEELDKIIARYQEVSRNLVVMVNAGDLTREQLVQLYLQVIDIEVQQGSHPYVGTDCGSQLRMSALPMGSQATLNQLSDPFQAKLVDAIASAVSLNEVTLDTLFDMYDKKADTSKPALTL